MSDAIGQRAEDIEERAAMWFSRRRGGRFASADERELQVWLRADPAHARAFAEIGTLWDELGLLPRPALRASSRRRRHSRWRWPALAASLLLACALSLVWRDLHDDELLSLATAAHELREVRLADGSQVHLNRGTRLRVDLRGGRREVELLQGEAFFSVAHDSRRPFVVSAGEGAVRVLGTRFDVRRGEASLDVAVEQGRVELRAHAGDAPELLVAGDRATYDYRGGKLFRSRQGLDEVAGWRQGYLIFQQRPLGLLLDELAQYRQAPVTLLDPALAGRRISGSLDVGRPDDFLEALPSLLPVHVERREGGEVRISSR